MAPGLSLRPLMTPIRQICADSFRSLFRRGLLAGVLLRILIELLLAGPRTKVKVLSLIIALFSGGLFVYLHSAYWIRLHFKSPPILRKSSLFGRGRSVSMSMLALDRESCIDPILLSLRVVANIVVAQRSQLPSRVL